MESLAVMGDQMGALLTAEVAGSFGILQYPLIALAAPPGPSVSTGAGQTPGYSRTKKLLARKFRRACNGDYADIALKAQPADGSALCRISPDGLVSLWLDDTLVWFERINPKDTGTLSWLQAAKTRQVTLISGDYLRISEAGVDPTAAADKQTLVMAKIPTSWT